MIPIWCPTCKEAKPHTSTGELIVCECGQVRLDDVPLLIARVQQMRFCPWCRETKPADHDCPAGAVGCTSRQPDETPCGACGRCLAAMSSDPRYGSPSDMDHPEVNA